MKLSALATFKGPLKVSMCLFLQWKKRETEGLRSWGRVDEQGGVSLWYYTTGVGEGFTKSCLLLECCAVRGCLDTFYLLLYDGTSAWYSTQCDHHEESSVRFKMMSTCHTMSRCWLYEQCDGSRWRYIRPLSTSTLSLFYLSCNVSFSSSFIALAWQSAQS